MPVISLTERTINALKTEKAQEDFWDGSFQNPGIRFGVRCYRSGRKEFIVRYWNAEGKRPQLNLGNVLSLTLAEARKRARGMAAARDDGEDPARVRDEWRGLDSVKVLCDRFIANFEAMVEEGKRRAQTLSDYRHTVKKYIKPAWGDLKVCDVRRRDVIDLLESIAIGRKAPVQARRVRAFTHGLFSYALSRELIETNPCVGLPRLGAATPRTRTLSDQEIGGLWTALEKVPFVQGALFKIILLTAQRPGEIAGMRWDEIQGSLWTIPVHRSKNKKAHTVPLTPAVLSLLNEVRLVNARAKLKSKCFDSSHFDTYVFPSRYSGKSNKWVANQFRLRVLKGTTIKKCTPHDLRRTGATHLQKLGVSSDIIDKILNHIPQDVTRRHYVHYDALREKQEALEKLTFEIERIVADRGLFGLRAVA